MLYQQSVICFAYCVKLHVHDAYMKCKSYELVRLPLLKVVWPLYVSVVVLHRVEHWVFFALYFLICQIALLPPPGRGVEDGLVDLVPGGVVVLGPWSPAARKTVGGRPK